MITRKRKDDRVRGYSYQLVFNPLVGARDDDGGEDNGLIWYNTRLTIS